MMWSTDCLAYDEKANVVEWLYKIDSNPSFFDQFNVIKLSLLGFGLCFICEPHFVSS